MTDKTLAINDLLFEQALGDYQWDLLTGRQCWSGSDLRGEAARYSGRYAGSRSHLLARIQEALAPRGWRAVLGYVLMGEPRRWHLRLILVDGEGRQIDHLSGEPADRVELPEDVYYRPGFELRAVAP